MLDNRHGHIRALDSRRQIIWEYAPVVLTLLLGIAVSLFVQNIMKRDAKDVARYDFGEDAKRCIGSIERELNTNFDLIKWLGATLAATPDLTEQQFHDLTTALFAGQPTSMELQWWPRVPCAMRAQFEQSGQIAGIKDFQIREFGTDNHLTTAGLRDIYFPLFFSQDTGTHPSYLGFDLQSDPALQRYVSRAAEKGEMFFASDSTYLKSAGGTGTVLALYPVYKKGTSLGTIEDRRANLQGFSAGLIDLPSLTDIAFGGPSQFEIDVHIFDFFGEAGHKFLYYRPGPSQHETEPYISEARSQAVEQLNYTSGIDLGNTRRWLITCTPSPNYALGLRVWSPSLGLLLGLAFTAIIAYHFHGNIRQRRAAEALVVRRTAELERSNEHLVHEIAERKRFEHERDGLLDLLEASNTSLQQLNTQLERSNRDLQDFALVASHDLREPLRKVRVLAQSLRDRLGRTLDTGAREYLDLMEGALQRMHHLITNLLQVSRVSTHGKPFVPVDLSHALTEVVSDLAVRIEETGASIDAGTLPTVQADPAQMRQLLQNMIENSLKYHRSGTPPYIEIQAVRDSIPVDNGGTPVENGTVTIRFRDNGIGFAPDQTERAFTLFQRLGNDARVEGNGVGLAVCRKIAERHGGSISVRSEVGAGSTFILTLPRSHDVA